MWLVSVLAFTAVTAMCRVYLVGCVGRMCAQTGQFPWHVKTYRKDGKFRYNCYESKSANMGLGMKAGHCHRLKGQYIMPYRETFQ